MALPAEITAVARHAGRALPGAGALGARHAHLAGDQSGQPPELAGADRHGDDRSQDLLQSEPLAEARRLLPTERLAGRAQPAPVALVVLAAAVVGSLLVKIELRLGGEVRILPTRNSDVRTEVEGLVAEVYAREGMRVQQGDLVARLSDRDLTAELQKTEAQLAEKQATLRMRRIGPRPGESRMAREETVNAEERVRGNRVTAG